ncbi:MAG: sodium:alanine symporter family protein [Campylobacteraceae bacterium]|nr:sodium:alanine symporter family protein [Campylobacteraceae bacterium]
MKSITVYLDSVYNFVTGPFLLIPLLLGVGIFLTIGLRFISFKQLPHALITTWKGRKYDPEHKGEISPFRALMTSLAATVGTGNIVGVATAIMMGGPGAIFWMWLTALFGMATKFCEAVLAVKYREVTPDGSFVGGPMYYIKNGLGKNWRWLAVIFAVFGMIASFGIGNMVQTNSITLNIVNFSDGLLTPPIVATILLMFGGAVMVGGIKRIGHVAGIFVPIMAVFYVLCGIIVLIMNIDKVPAAFGLIFSSAFTGHAAVGGFAGSTLAMAIRFGVARGLFSNEAGLGSAPIAHAAAIVKNPVKQGLLGMIDPFLDTIIICSISALIILVSGEWINGDYNNAATLTTLAFNSITQGTFGSWLVTISLTLFAFSTVLGWCVYGERCAIYLFGHKAAPVFRIIFTLAVPIGALAELKLVWSLSDLFNALMAIPNLIALVLLSPVVFKMAKEYFKNPDE